MGEFFTYMQIEHHKNLVLYFEDGKKGRGCSFAVTFYALKNFLDFFSEFVIDSAILT